VASQTSLLGAAGEYFVMSELLRRGFIAAIAPQGVLNTDIVVSDLVGNRLCAIQVKTRRAIGSDGGWHMSEKHETIIGEKLFYCFVDFGNNGADDHAQVFIVPSGVVAEVVRVAHKRWKETPGKKGQQRSQDSKMRRFLPDYSHIFTEQDGQYRNGWLGQYKSNWDLLQLKPVSANDAGDED
jgi:hypothetical protein